MFSSVLIANRGEIAVRIMRTCRRMGIRTIAVYSDPDRFSMHTRMADESVALGGTTAVESYLHGDAIIEAARQSDVEAIHPGYGFLAENASFARAVVAAGMSWIGPPADAIEAMGDKVRAKQVAIAAGVPVVPGFEGPDMSYRRVAAEAEAIGYPIMLKAIAGGGGKGMRVVTDPDALEAALEGAAREAAAAFGDGRMFLEKLLVRPRHIEVQVIADSAGTVLYLGERDCSVQRRHQKVVEEAPAPGLSAEMRRDMGDAAARLARAGNYCNAGTVEFLYHDGRFYFLEMNTRIQVEHPVTEAVTGLDLVQLQLEVAAGESLSLTQEDVREEGHAIEARLYAEDPDSGFLPSIGRLHTFRPPERRDVRIDTGVEPGTEVSPFYDPMLAKLIVHGATRGDAVKSLERALASFRIEGVATNLAFLEWLTREPAFRQGAVDVDFVDREWLTERERPVPYEALVLAAIVDSGRLAGPEGSRDPWRSMQGWRPSGVPRTYRYLWAGACLAVEMSDDGANWSVTIGDREARVRVLSVSSERPEFGSIELEIDGERLEGKWPSDAGRVTVQVAGRGYEFTRFEPSLVHATGRGSRNIAGALTAPMPGTVVKIHVEPGQRVAAHEPLLVLEAMKMEHVIEAPYAGVVEAILFERGDMVSAGAAVVRMGAE